MVLRPNIRASKLIALALVDRMGEQEPPEYRGMVGLPLVEGAYVLGRDPNVELYFSSPSVSRRHARVFVEGAIVTVEDLGSKNGTFVAGRRIEARTTIAAGDTIRIGSVELSIRALAEDATETL